jgi:hypothetical protein
MISSSSSNSKSTSSISLTLSSEEFDDELSRLGLSPPILRAATVIVSLPLVEVMKGRDLSFFQESGRRGTPRY